MVSWSLSAQPRRAASVTEAVISRFVVRERDVAPLMSIRSSSADNRSVSRVDNIARPSDPA
ncbi:hypothetical protein CH253_22595 [Rhodococcus sp. 06-156-3C]|nr:hypothetical protein CH248_29255 [Rhodococcus sp. 06-156-4a]OZD15760.1 hypothetical protein CH253_22595 [Rhodococcus sp. 06-156-3C]OZD21144.1 hypothetical protein CH280_02825 [Rhodococcus sp. 06-156-4C]OZD32327.1 hypothetical protein CH284_20755 [Rhodococcus sp. 06-156-3]OZD36548.1 hypothetical protein CH247_03180 [Rhodococcus sp. 06-156-3b]OZF59268.1 hypothetical protein CH290_21650 [Rhodococcus sp. 06-156-4]